MIAVVIDTNVLVVANEKSHAGPDCVRECVHALRAAQSAIVVVDSEWLVLREYCRNARSSGQPGVGDEFLLWLLRNRANPIHCETVALTRLGPDTFAEFPTDPELSGFDPSDRKFVAVACASRHAPEILNATDTDWWRYRAALAGVGIRVRFLCPEAMPP